MKEQHPVLLVSGFFRFGVMTDFNVNTANELDCFHVCYYVLDLEDFVMIFVIFYGNEVKENYIGQRLKNPKPTCSFFQILTSLHVFPQHHNNFLISGRSLVSILL